MQITWVSQFITKKNLDFTGNTLTKPLLRYFIIVIIGPQDAECIDMHYTNPNIFILELRNRSFLQALSRNLCVTMDSRLKISGMTIAVIIYWYYFPVGSDFN